jgi:hypothetical protein
LTSAIPLLVTACLLLIPLVPASILYLVLSPRKGGGEGNTATGEVAAPFSFGNLKLQFHVVGSSATYVVLLVVAIAVHAKVEEDRTKEEAVKSQRAWLVEVPVNLKTQGNDPFPANKGEMQQVRVELEPSPTQASANNIQFWVLPNNGRFPTARFSLSSLSLAPTTIDLNDSRRMHFDYGLQRMSGIAPVWITVGAPYDGH